MRAIPKFSEVLQRVRRVTLDAYRNQDMPIEEIFRALRVPRGLDRNALLRVMFILQNAVPRVPALPGLSVQFVDVDPGTARCDLVLEIVEAGDELDGWFEYDVDLFESDTIARMASHLRVMLEAVLEEPDTPISRLPLLPAWERWRVLVDWNDTNKRSAPRGDFFQRFAKHVERTPDAVAVTAGRVRLSYRDLADRSAAIAERLAAAGVRGEAVVGVLAERGADFSRGDDRVAAGRTWRFFPWIRPFLRSGWQRSSRTAAHDWCWSAEAAQPCSNGHCPARRPRARPEVLELEEVASALPRTTAAARLRPRLRAWRA